ncbi:PREDICTED: stabilizer of axonemal microtubules 2-like [Dufourea novaeangliae]|uniref:stabilizer of axonemal microtubules 2-like n=1 Tax=Dufourea novaeangliae TaxID=178035 RepID=UPI000767AA5E|nr:PREDICTED: stabilizer of axonemal microtubules 2-like [Dufourea novaeangliae]
MEMVEINTKKKEPQLPVRQSLDYPCNVRCTKRYVQPSRVKSFAPERLYCPPSKLLETNTTYHLSYLNVDYGEMRRSRSQPIRPVPVLATFDGKFSNETTNKFSYKPIGHVPKAKPIVPRQRPMMTGRMECMTTVRNDYARKHVERPEIVVPCGHIRLSTGKLDASTTAKLSYANPGHTEPTINFKPIRAYCPPNEPVCHQTTQKLSYQPVQVPEKESCPWQMKPTYRAPDVAMCGKTTYSVSYLQNDEPCTEKPIRPVGTNIFPHGGDFAGRTIYKESYLESDSIDRVEPIIPSNSISKADGKISGDTTNKLSYQPVQTEKRDPILPRCRNMMGDGPMQSETTNRSDFVPKAYIRPGLIVPCSNLRNADKPMDDTTTTRLSYVIPGPIQCVQSFKPVVQYTKSAHKIDGESVSKLSYQAWTPPPKEHIPWADKGAYQPPTDPMCADTIYQASFPAPGHYEEICEDRGDCDCLDRKNPPCPTT